ncbi:MAG: sigma-70 family RNA polymerase sigma factor [Phycisphaerales bacterium]|nr:sigma-70 family RNA polymerase sigma factor [Phycisphaerales bacterium]|tara:strand:+ start:9142 stop:9720 length:579 start_codon:yes stop_codon:yes gene_type:complete
MTAPLDRERLSIVLHAAIGGDEAAWSRIVNDFSPQVFRVVLAQCRDPELAEEVTQSTFCTVVNKLSDYTELGKFESWLFRIALNRLRDEMRRRSRQALPMADDTLRAVAPAQEVSVSATEGQEVLKGLHLAMSELPEPEQQVLHLRHVAQMSFKAIADVLDEPMGTVLARHFRAIKRLRERLGSPDGRDLRE